MRTILLLSLAFLVAVPAAAGEIFGTISQGGKPVAAGVKVQVTAGEKKYDGETDKFGAYRVFVKEKGKCTITVRLGEDKAPAADLVSYDKSTRYDWVVGEEEGKTVLRRK